MNTHFGFLPHAVVLLLLAGIFMISGLGRVVACVDQGKLSEDIAGKNTNDDNPLSAAPDPEGLEIRRKVVYYEVEGESGRDLLASMRRSGPQNSGRRFFGYHEWDIRWAFRYASGPDECRMEDVRVELTSTTTLPRWNRPTERSEGLGAQWKEFMAALEGHERGHEAIVEAGARKLLRSLNDLRVDHCEQMNAKANELAENILTSLQEKDRTYDRETRYGAAQDAVWPPQQASRRGGSNWNHSSQGNMTDNEPKTPE